MKHRVNHICRNTVTATCISCMILSGERFITSHSGPDLELKGKIRNIVYFSSNCCS